MTDRPSDTAPLSRRAAIGGGLLLGFLGLLALGLLALVLLGRPASAPGAGAAATPTADPASFAYAEPIPAPPLELTDQDGQPFTLASQRGRPVLAFFGYTHCPDVCPATVGVVNEVLAAVGDGPRAVFTSIDPERDDRAAMKSYLTYLPKAYVGLSGTPAEVRRNADGWGVEYARIEQEFGCRLRDGAHGRHLPRRRAGHAPGALPVRDGRGADDRGRAGAARRDAAPGRCLGAARHASGAIRRSLRTFLRQLRPPRRPPRRQRRPRLPRRRRSSTRRSSRPASGPSPATP